MPMIELPNVWDNPFARMGILSVNVLIGKGIEHEDRDLFFGPLDGDEVFVGRPNGFQWMEFSDTMPLHRLLSHLHIFASAKEAARRGYSGEIAEGFTDITVKAALRFTANREHRVTILKITKPEGA